MSRALTLANLPALPETTTHANRMEIKSESSNRVYVIAQMKYTGEWQCSCPGWVMKKAGKPRGCKHLTELMPTLEKLGDSARPKRVGPNPDSEVRKQATNFYNGSLDALLLMQPLASKKIKEETNRLLKAVPAQEEDLCDHFSAILEEMKEKGINVSRLPAAVQKLVAVAEKIAKGKV